VFSTVLVANRGEIAVRVMRTLRRLGIRSTAIFSEADREALHVALADEGMLVGPADAASSYLDIERVVAAAVASGAQAVHPGYGFLSENANFAEACERAGLVFIGPRSESIRAMGDKRAAKDAAAALGVPTIPGFHREGATDEEFADRAASIGFPVMIKPAAGGGGKGMRVVRDAAEVTTALASARREAMSAFGDDTLLLEKYIPHARHVEVQILGDGEGQVIHLGDRDCSLQRRHQKVIEEAPAPNLPDEVRARIHADAVALASSIRYRGVGTVEFVVEAGDPSNYFFLEVNTRLQVEHTVTETVTGLDLVELQLKVAAGLGIPLTQDELRVSGHAVEARIYAEDGHQGFLPASGTILAYTEPTGVRVDSGITAGSVIGTSYDPLMLKVIASGPDRTAAFDALHSALGATVVLGVAHNVGVLRELAVDPNVREGSMNTELIASLHLGEKPVPLDDHTAAAAALAWLEHDRAESPRSLWNSIGAWRVSGYAPVPAQFLDDAGQTYACKIIGAGSERQVVLREDKPRHASITTSAARAHEVVVSLAGVARTYSVAFDCAGGEDVIWVGRDGDAWRLHRPRRDHPAPKSGPGTGAGEVLSPMPGAVVVVGRSVGESVSQGDVIVVVEAMKMEYSLAAPIDGVVSSLLVSMGTQVARNQLVAIVSPEVSA
jgi:acetyl-CoA/propionyl-CoA carboxylase biotin carboxyl carrier protein